MLERIVALLGSEAESLLRHECRTMPRERLHLPGPGFVERVHADNDRNARVKRALGSIFSHGRLAGSGYLSVLPVDQGVEHTDFRPQGLSEIREGRRGAAQCHSGYVSGKWREGSVMTI
jgi:hypothetical protein